jgi:hypothetical protein
LNLVGGNDKDAANIGMNQKASENAINSQLKDKPSKDKTLNYG